MKTDATTSLLSFFQAKLVEGSQADQNFPPNMVIISFIYIHICFASKQACGRKLCSTTKVYEKYSPNLIKIFLY